MKRGNFATAFALSLPAAAAADKRRFRIFLIPKLFHRLMRPLTNKNGSPANGWRNKTHLINPYQAASDFGFRHNLRSGNQRFPRSSQQAVAKPSLRKWVNQHHHYGSFLPKKAADLPWLLIGFIGVGRLLEGQLLCERQKQFINGHKS